jgi:hypothetical protein
VAPATPPAFDPAGPPVQEFLPSIGGPSASAAVTFPGSIVQPNQPAHPHQEHPQGGPQQPRPQPGITPDLPGHSAA